MISEEAVDLLRLVEFHQQQIKKSLQALENIRLDIEATGGHHWRELSNAGLIELKPIFGWRGQNDLTWLSYSGSRAARLATATLGPWEDSE